jgi:hypothetical protein
MSGFKRKPMPSADELTAALRGHASELPTATGGTEATARKGGEGGKPRKALPTVQINWNASEPLARIIAEEAAKAGSTRRFIARLMKDAGYDVPEDDLSPRDNRRRWTE